MRRSPIALALGLLFVMLTQRSALADGLLNPDPTDVQEAQGISADTTLKACVQNAGPNRNSTVVYGQFTDHQGIVRDLLGDVYQPTLPGPRPAALLVHGGGWVGGCRSLLDGLSVMLAHEGFIVMNIDYRLACGFSDVYLCGYQFAVQPTDVRTAMHYLRTHASSLAPFNGKVAAIGTSAGGNLVYMVGDVGIQDDTKPDVVAGLSGPAELGYTNCQDPCIPNNKACDQAYFPPGALNICWPNTQAFVGPPLGSGTPCNDSWAVASPACPPNITPSNPPPPTFIGNSRDELVAFNEALDISVAIPTNGQPDIRPCWVSDGDHLHGTQLLGMNVHCEQMTSKTVYDYMVEFLISHTT